MKRRGTLTGFGAFIARAAVVATATLVLTTCNQSLLKYLIEQGGHTFVSNFTIRGTYGYTGRQDKINVLNVTKPWEIWRIASVEAESITSFAVSGSWAYTLETFGTGGGQNCTVGIYSLETRDSPSLDETVDLGHEAGGDQYTGTIHCAEDSSWVIVATGVEFMLIGDPGEGLGAASIGGTVSTSKSSSILDRGDYVYVAGSNGIDVIDISDFMNPTIVHTIDVLDAIQMVWMGESYGDKMLVAAGVAKLHVVDVSTPAAPVVTGPTGQKQAYDVTVRGDYAYADHDRRGDDSEPVGFSVYDLSDLSEPIYSLKTDLPVLGVYAFE